MKHHEVHVYVSEDCKECDDLLDFLEEKNVKHISKNTSKNKEYLEEMQKENIYMTPVMNVRGKWVQGFQTKQINQVLGL
ncbi:glutaredoxin family protein [Gracilibacillus oryzae]|uniref:Glutaredoxin family protein n=1 Tax=Gracilibacillus oryzae TaxID=1672701 RepID=A0A7C8GU59_9BACI|nr:glutaredoxin family protein [Gracilibacillus oryzae]KAB8137965.1 glutaredoxin family protein [Gracilibacillus oryzae]